MSPKNAGRMMIGGRWTRAALCHRRADRAWRAVPGGTAQESLGDWIARNGARLVGQEAVTLSTTPPGPTGGWCRAPLTIRVFAARTAAGWTFMPGGYARIGKTGDTTALAMGRRLGRGCLGHVAAAGAARHAGGLGRVRAPPRHPAHPRG